MSNHLSKLNFTFLLTLFVLLTLQGCKKEETQKSTNNSNKTIVKYEIVSPVPTIADSTLSGLGSFHSVIIYANDISSGSGGIGLEYNKYSYTVWTKEIDITNSARPFNASLNARGYVPVTSGSASYNIYVNGTLKAHADAPIKQSSIKDSVGVFDLTLLGGNPVFKIN